MLNLLQSNRMPVLAEAFCERNASPRDPFEPQTVVVQSFGIGQWLKLQLAEHQGIAANVDCVLPAAFLWRMYRNYIPETENLTRSPFDRSRLTWRIMRVLADTPALSQEVSHYLAGPGDSHLRHYQLACEIAGLFDEYLMYRPRWILDWEKSGHSPINPMPHEQWQIDLWRLLMADIGHARHLNRASLHRQLMTALGKAEPQAPEQRLSVFGLSTMPPLQLETFEALARCQEVDIYFLNPCEHYWGDIFSEREVARKRSIRALVTHDDALVEEDYLEIGNPLLAALGRQGREYLEMLLESVSLQSHDHFAPADNDTALGFVKNDILNLTYGGEFGVNSAPTDKVPGDQTLQVHICHSRMREVEVLLDQVLHAMADNPEIRANDILVMVPDISVYAPYIHSVFTGRLAHRIADRPGRDDSSLLPAFLTLLSLPEARVTGAEVMDLLEVPAIARRFRLSAADLEKIALWINDAGIRWEESGDTKAKYWGLPAENQNTWSFGLNRLLLGFTLSSELGPWQHVLPLDVSPADAELVGKLSHFLSLIGEYREQISEPAVPGGWRELTGLLIDAFFEPADEEVLEISQLIAAVEDFELSAAESDYTSPVSVHVLRHCLNDKLTADSGSAGFISGGITFATLIPMRSIPFKMICLLGMNDGEYPRTVRPHSFDLIASGGHQRGDRSKRLDDRYLFLESLISAEDIFYVSYIGRGNRDNKARPPSVVVSEWLNYLNAVFENAKAVVHPLQPFNSAYYHPARGLPPSFEKRWFTALTSPEAPPKFIDTALPDENVTCTSLPQLQQFFRNTAAYFMQQRLGVYFNQADVELKDTEPFSLGGLDRYQLTDGALATLIAGDDLDRWRDGMLVSGSVMSGVIGNRQLDTEIARAEDIYAVARPYLTEQPQSLGGSLHIDDHELRLGTINLYGQQIIDIRAGELRDRHLLTIWIDHLAANLLVGDITTLCIAKGSGKKGTARQQSFLPVPRDECEPLLNDMLSIYAAGMTSPLFLPPETSRAFSKSQSESRVTALADAKKAFMKNFEHADPYWQRLFTVPEDLDATFQTNAATLWQPLESSRVS